MAKALRIIGLVFIFVSFSAWSQVYISEDFSSTVFPGEGWQISSEEANRAVSETETAGGQTP